MSGLPANDPRSGHSQPQTQRSLSRRVSFNESTLRQSPRSVTSSVVTDIEGQTKIPPKKPASRFNIYCAWASLGVGVVIIILLVLAGVTFAFFQGNLPDFIFQSLNVTSLAVVKSPDSDTLLNAEIDVVLNATNKNAKLPVSYNSMTANLESGDVLLGSVPVPELVQQPHDLTQIKLHYVLANMSVAEADAKDLQTKSEKHQLLVDLTIGGRIHFYIGGQRMAGFPFKVLCQDIYQGDLDTGDTPQCTVKMTPVS